mgnify:CR=1 FL=1
MSKRLSLIFIATLIHLSVSAAGNYEDWWQKGNNYFDQKAYDSAAMYFNKIATLQPHNAEVYYNLGNTYYRLNQVGKAVLNYERALKYDPGHKLAADNLYLTQSRITNRIQHIPEIFFVRWWKGMTGNNLTNIYAGIAAILFLAAIGYFIAKRMGYVNIDVPVQLSAAVIVLSAVFVFLSIASARGLVSSNHAIVMQEGAPMMKAPKYGTSQSLIPEGIKVEIHNQEPGWHEVKLPDGRMGWLEQTALEKI